LELRDNIFAWPDVRDFWRNSDRGYFDFELATGIQKLQGVYINSKISLAAEIPDLLLSLSSKSK
jgi:hypothetical protein